MTKYVSENELRKKLLALKHDLTARSLLEILINDCKEPNSWIPLEEFLKSGFIGACWICTREKEIIECNFNGVVFSYGRRSIISVIFVTHVQPSHKPEPPQDD